MLGYHGMFGEITKDYYGNFEQNYTIRILPSKIQSKLDQGHTAVLKNMGLYLIDCRPSIVAK